MTVADAVANQPRTRLIRDAEARGCGVLDGLGMLVNQGAANIRYWTGVDADRTVMRRALERRLHLKPRDPASSSPVKKPGARSRRSRA
jgi:shikimate dehydrogenase